MIASGTALLLACAAPVRMSAASAAVHDESSTVACAESIATDTAGQDTSAGTVQASTDCPPASTNRATRCACGSMAKTVMVTTSGAGGNHVGKPAGSNVNAQRQPIRVEVVVSPHGDSPKQQPTGEGADKTTTGSTNDPPGSAECLSKDLEIGNPDSLTSNAPKAYRLNGQLAVFLKDGCLAQLKEALAKHTLPESVTLYLNRGKMEGLPVDRFLREADNATYLQFTLSRDPADEKSRAAWDTFLGSKDRADFPTNAALSIDGEPAVAIRAQDGITFGVSSNRAIKIAAGVSFLILVGLFLGLLLKSGAFLDARGRFSLGRIQVGFWGLLVLLTVVALWFVTGAIETVPDQIMTLLGISTLTGLGAIAVDASKDAERLTALKTEAQKLVTLQATNQAGFDEAGGGPRLAAIQAEREEMSARANSAVGRRRNVKCLLSDITNDGYGLSFHRLQACLWTAFLGWVFVNSVIHKISMPAFDDSLLLLMGISSGTYLGFKYPEKPKADAPTEPAS